MRVRTSAMILIMVSLIACKPKSPDAQTKMTETMLFLQEVERFNTAFKVCDIETLESMIADQYQHSNGSSKAIDKETWLSYLQIRKAQIESGELLVQKYEMTETQVSLHENTAILSAKISVSSTWKGKAIQQDYRVTNVWIKERKKWKRAGFHDGKIELNS